MRPLRPRGGTDRHHARVTLTHMETENQKIVGVRLPADSEIETDPNGNPVLVLPMQSARFLASVLNGAHLTAQKEAVRAEAEAAGADMSTYMDWQLGCGGVVWTAKGGTVMVQRVEPGDLTPEDARTLAQVLNEAADYAEGEK